MAVSNKPIYAKAINSGRVQILPATLSNFVTVLTPGADGSRVERILMTSTDTTARDVQFYVSVGGIDYLIGTVTLPANSGFVNSIPSLNALAHAQLSSALSSDNNGNRYLQLKFGEVLRAKTLTTVTAAKIVNIQAAGGDF